MASQEAIGGHGAAAPESVWSGGGSPYAVGSKKLGMWLFIVSDAITFSSLLIAYSFVRVSSANWPLPFEWSIILNATIMTTVLLSSIVSMVMGECVPQLGTRCGGS